MVTARNLQASSNSTATVALTQHANRLCVIKQSCGDQARFSLNVQKQKMFKALALSGLTISAAPVIEDFRTESSVSIIMPYIHGLNGADFALYGNREIGHDIARAFSALLNDTMSRADIQDIPVHIFFDKLDQIQTATRSVRLGTRLCAAKELLQRKLSGVATLATPISECHGDLTLSNIIFSHSSGLVLVDFLSSFIESPLQDLAKIRQDLAFGWSFRSLDRNLQIKAKVFCDLAFPGYAKFLTSLFPLQSYVFGLLCLARIAPYVRDDITECWLSSALDAMLSEEPTLQSSGFNKMNNQSR